MEIALACGDDRVLHAELARELLDRAPAGVRVLDVGFGVQLEELQRLVLQAKELAPAPALEAEPTPLPQFAAAVARHVHPLGAGIGDDAFEPVAVRPQTPPRPPPEAGRGERPRPPGLRAGPAGPVPQGPRGPPAAPRAAPEGGGGPPP